MHDFIFFIFAIPIAFVLLAFGGFATIIMVIHRPMLTFAIIFFLMAAIYFTGTSYI